MKLLYNSLCLSLIQSLTLWGKFGCLSVGHALKNINFLKVSCFLLIFWYYLSFYSLLWQFNFVLLWNFTKELLNLYITLHKHRTPLSFFTTSLRNFFFRQTIIFRFQKFCLLSGEGSVTGWYHVPWGQHSF